MPRTGAYEMYCPVAKALDVIGERWTLLILRDLMQGDRRFTDLRASVVGIPPNMLSQRLKSLVNEGLVTTRELPPPAARTVYGLTPEGRRVAPVLRSLIRFGMGRLPAADEHVTIPPSNVVASALTAYFDPESGVRGERYVVDVEGNRFELSSDPGPTAAASDHSAPPAVVVTAPRWVLVNLRNGTSSWDAAVADGVLAVTGTKRAVATFRRVFQLT